MARRRRHRRKERKLWLVTFPALGLVAGLAPWLIESGGFDLTAAGAVAIYFLVAFVPAIILLALRRETRGAWVFTSFALLTFGVVGGWLAGVLLRFPPG